MFPDTFRFFFSFSWIIINWSFSIGGFSLIIIFQVFIFWMRIKSRKKQLSFSSLIFTDNTNILIIVCELHFYFVKKAIHGVHSFSRVANFNQKNEVITFIEFPVARLHFRYGQVYPLCTFDFRILQVPLAATT